MLATLKWSRDGRELLLETQYEHVMAVSETATRAVREDSFVAGKRWVLGNPSLVRHSKVKSSPDAGPRKE